MEYMQRTAALRAEPQSLLPGAQSAVVVGLNYAPAVQSADASKPTHAAFSIYAYGDDYHDVIREKLKALLAELQLRVPTCQGRICVDSAPVMERELAWLAGLGWYGKNTCLINTYRGSYFFIGVLLLTLELEYDHPAFGGCGKCTRCLEACPTGALTEPYHLDARKCISYLTIELKGSIPEPLRAQMGNWVFGCDLCQQVCPFNQPRPHAPLRARPTSEPRFHPRPITQAPPLQDLLTMEEEQFRQVFRGSAVKRTKRRGLIRNAAVAAGNSAQKQFLPLLRRLTEDPDPIVQEHARWAIEKLGSSNGGG